MKPIVINYEPARSMYFRHARNYNRKVYYYGFQGIMGNSRDMCRKKITQSTAFHRENEIPQSLQKKQNRGGRYSSAILQKDKKLKNDGFIDMNLSDLTNFLEKSDIKQPTRKFSQAISNSFIKNEQIKKYGSIAKSQIKDSRNFIRINLKKLKNSKMVPISINTQEFFNEIKPNNRYQNPQQQSRVINPSINTKLAQKNQIQLFTQEYGF